MDKKTNTDTPDRQVFREKFGKNRSAKARFNRAIRDEFPGGDILLDLLEIVHAERRQIERGHGSDPLKTLMAIEDHIQAIRDEAIHSIKEQYNLL